MVEECLSAELADALVDARDADARGQQGVAVVAHPCRQAAAVVRDLDEQPVVVEPFLLPAKAIKKM